MPRIRDDNDPTYSGGRLVVRGDHIIEAIDGGGQPIIHEGAALLVENGRVAAILPWRDLQGSVDNDLVVGGPGKVVMPGLVNAHHHVGLTPLQLGSPDLPLELWFASRMGLRDVDPYLDTLYAAFEMVASGVTTVQHLHGRVAGGLAQLAAAARRVLQAYRDLGMRASYSMGIRDQNRLVYMDDDAFAASLPELLAGKLRAHLRQSTVPLADQLSLHAILGGETADEALLAIQLGPANLHWLSDAALDSVARVSAESGALMHIHLLETPYQKEYARRRTGGSALAHLAEIGLTGPRLTLGHGVWMSEADIELCAATGTHICHNCSSNLRLRSGIAPVNHFLARGIPVALGLDEAGINDDRDMLQEMRIVLRLHRTPGMGDDVPTPSQVLRMATEHGAATTPFGATIGRLAPGCWADAVVLDWRTVTFPYQNDDIPLVDVLVQRARANAVETVVIGGEIVYRMGQFMRVDRAAVLDEIAARMRRPLTPDEMDRKALGKAIFPFVSGFYQDYLPNEFEPLYRFNSSS